MEEQPRTQAKGSMLKNIFIIILVAVIIILLFSNTLKDDTKEKFYWFAAFIALLAFIFYILNRNRKLNIYKVALEIVDREYEYTGRNINIAEVNCDILDADTMVFGFESSGELVAYKYDRIDSNVIARLTKKIDEVKNETNNREIFNLIAKRNLDKSINKKLAEQNNMEIEE